MKLINSFLIFFFIFVSCKSAKEYKNSNRILNSENNPKTISLNNWYQKDYQEDTISGISLDKWYRLNKKKPKIKNIIVAVIDTQIDINHEDLKGQLWINNKEIPNNGIDDDQNGYIDDINGWSFTGTKSGGYVVWNRYEYVRILQEWTPLFKDKTESQIDSKDLYKYNEYQRALKKFEEKDKFYKNWLKSLDHNVAIYPLVKDTLKHFFPKEDYTYRQLDSLYKKYKINDKRYRQRRDDGDTDLGALISYMMVSLDVDQNSLQDILDQQTQLDSIVNKNLNINYNERLSIGDNPNILEKGYGNNNVSNNKVGHRPIQDHNTMVSGILAANRNNDIGIKGIADIKIMPLNISPSGDEHDKDIAMAVRYAVDNGAKIINMSFGKEFSMHKDWVSEAFKYAEEHNVLLVHSAGNDSENLDKVFHYPNDQNYEGIRGICNNFISVGSTTKNLGEKLVSDYSNYGKENVDLFAPGEDIYTTGAGNIYKTDSGTSFSAPMVSGTAAIIWSYYPNLTAAQVKQIIMDSGTAYNFEVILPGTKDKKVPFSELSKSGKVLNVYNAMQLAKKIR
ncbi:S8 family serine peptidase [Flavobacterium sp. GSB-24]|uniref:S8 family serine peptidase n=1 Tax=Flavobacterium sp. GSB-24 TaxID=2994319 RepID=UPI00249143F4|nr:S8 family serine peptidase [Flavobacterium sp. GSB-24]BDU24941.1 peptidase S8 [Flavobacterium sp. GSB-24]